MRGEGEGPLPVERELGDDRLVERRRAGRRVVALRAPEPEAVDGLLGAGGASRPDEPRQPGDAGVDQDPVDVDPAQAGAEPVVADDQDRRAPAVGQLAEQADRVVQAADDLARGRRSRRGSSIPVSSTFR